MSDSIHYLSSSSPTKPSLIQKIPSSDVGETNENDRDSHQMGSNLKNQKKTTKNFMSPTISAASKVVVPRRNILAEMNESSESIFTDTHVQKPKPPNFDPNPSSASVAAGSISPILTLSSGISQFDDEEPKTFVSNSSSKPYDPLTNYLSPRPTFLRYNPDRRRKIFLRHENEPEETEDGTRFDKRGSFDSKNFIVEETSLSASGSSASSSDEGSAEQEGDEIEESEEEFEEERGWNLNGALNTLLVFVVLVLSTLYISTMNSPTPPPALQSIRNLKNEFWKNQNPLFGLDSPNYFEDGKEEFLDKCEEPVVGLADLSQKDSDEWVEVKNMVVDDDSYELGEGSKGVEMVAGENNGTVSEMDEVPEKIESFQDYQAPIISDWVYHQDTVSDLVVASEKEENADGDFRDELEQSLVTVEEISKEGYQEEVVAENELERLVDTSNKEEGEVVEQIETGSMANLAIGFSAIFAVIASLVLGFHFKRKRTSGKGPSPGIKPCSDYVIPENNNSLVVISSKAQEEHIDKVDSFVTSSSLSHSIEEASKEFYQSRAPTVELLGEFEVGELSTSSLRSCRMKSRLTEIDLSNYSISQEWSKGKSVPIQALSEFSSMDSPSFGSFTDEKKIIKKAEGRDGEVRKAITTPVRRSSRILKRAVASP